MNRRTSAIPLIIFALALSASSAQSQARATSAATQPGVARAEQRITGDGLLAHIRVLASDRFEGRGPGTRGEDSTIAYLSDQFRRMGLRPGNPDGSYVQMVPLVGSTSAVTASVTTRGGQTQALRQPDDYVAWSMRPDPLVSVSNSDIVFVGYGVVAPEFGWDDFKGVDVRGKTVVMLVGDPPVPDPRDPSRLDPRTFRGPAMTYYGRWTYKYEIAAERGAAACIIVHQTGPAGYAWGVVASNTGRERFDIQGAGARHIPIEGWIQLDVAKRLFAAAGQDFDALQRAAGTRAFRPVPLGATASFTVRNALREVRSRNVVARLDGSDPVRRGEYLLYTAHWDHFGIGRTIGGDSIYNGALDNAAGVAWLLETARAYRALPRAPRRTVVFMAVTAEEQGLLGARWYAAHPLYPLARTLADINMDIPNPWGRSRSIVSVSHGQSTLENLLARQAARVGRVVKPDPEPEKGYFYRSDHFELSRQGVPALAFLFPGADYIGQPADYGTRVRANYVANDYHKPTDEVKPDWDLTGMVDDTRLLFRVGLDVANGSAWPQWNPGTEFRAARERMLGR
ncbi:M28 family peptidase [Longimicrobium sp.]|uniref:M28 family peptidase n=1 Tax=Longimicrobium sp. TaxID=2029185 RepID=UPI002BCEFA75|nr:M28 family peptidase [Longimicrobium sp.]HSU14531.1 M28 family peptidase [Longimicrobium sp.]